MKVSVIALTVSALTCLNTKLVATPQTIPIRSETAPKMMNWNRIVKGVEAVNSFPYRDFTVLNKIIDTMSLKTPSPKMHENNFGWDS